MQTARIIPLIPMDVPVHISIPHDHPWLVEDREALAREREGFVRGSFVTPVLLVGSDTSADQAPSDANPGKLGLGEGLLTKLKQLVTHC